MIAIFKSKVLSFVQNLSLSAHQQDILTKEIVKFSLQLYGKNRSVVLRRCAFELDRLEEITFFKNQFLDVSKYVHNKLWKNVKNKIDDEDVKFCLSHLTDLEVKKLDSLAYPGIKGSFDFNAWFKKKAKYIKAKTYKLRFIKDYDACFDIEDFTQELACEAIRVVNAYERINTVEFEESLETRLEKYLERALNNKVKSIIEYNTSKSRRRTMTTNEALYAKLKEAKRELNLVKKQHQEYLENVVETRLDTFQWLTSDDSYITKQTLINHCVDQEIIDRVDDIITRGQLKKIFMEQPVDDSDVKFYENKLQKVYDEIKNTEGDYYARTITLDTAVENAIETEYCVDNHGEENVWWQELGNKTDNQADDEYIKLIIGDADESVEQDFQRFAGSTRNFKSRSRLVKKFISHKYKDWDIEALKKNKRLRECFYEENILGRGA